ncbi:MAG: COX15/CtaA family protein [Pontimonas sp.]|nr:COX15/CtaA family protein [Pontimonas sp.]
MKTLWNWLPSVTDRRVRIAAWASLISQILIIGTGGAVRLTGSGLGCPTWPRCTEDSFVTTAEMGFHGVIEFGNRLLTFVLIIIAIVMFAFVLRMRKERPELFRLSLGLGLGIPGQAVIGGVTVLTDLNPFVVGLHYLLSAVLVGFAAILLYRVRRGPRESGWGVPAPVRALGGALIAVLGISVVMGILTTGSGPHAGDAGAARNGLDSWLLQHFHAWPSYVVLGLVVTLTALAWFAGVGSQGFRRSITGSLVVTLIQIAVGLYQANYGLPVLAVGVHMVLAAVLVAFVVTALLTQREPATAEGVGQSRLRGTVASSS